MMSDCEIVSGTIFWPLYPYGVIRSDLIPQPCRVVDQDTIYCPNKTSNGICPILSDSKTDTNCAFDTANASHCPYHDYHSNFLLKSKLINTISIDDTAEFEQLNRSNKYFELPYIMMNHRHVVAMTMDYFPQYKECGKLLGGDYCLLMESTTAEVNLMDQEFWRYKKNGKEDDAGKLVHLDADTLSLREKFYTGCEFLGKRELDDTPAEVAFHHLVDIARIKPLLLNNISSKEGIIFPVWLSFFGDGKLDAFLSLLIKPELDRDHIAKNFVAQALGSISREIRMQRQEFLYHWNRQLLQRVGEEYDAYISHNGTTYTLSAIEAAKQMAVNVGTEALRRMILVLLANRDVREYASELFHEEMFELSALEEDTCSQASFNCFKGNNTIPNPIAANQDRCKFICKFCKQAKINIIEGLGAGKLKGALARDASADLMDIAKDDPVKARVLIRGEAGGGKGVAAEDFHAHCMERIAKATGVALRSIQESSLGDFTTTTKFESVVKDWTNVLIVEPKKDAEIESRVVYEYFDAIHKSLSGIKQLPPLASVSKQKHENRAWEIKKEQVVGTAWWLWLPVCKEDDFNSQYVEALKACVEKLLAESQPDNVSFANLFVAALSLKILHEFINKKDWSFNLFQVNCGIMGGQNSELAESIRRLFGQTDEDKAGKALPGLFQICSYVGGTLFLDEIADAPVRIQDNLLRPLEEGKVSRPGWETISEDVKNIRIVAATFKDLFKLAEQYRETLPSGNPKGFRPDLLTRLTRNPPVTITPVWHHFVPSARYTPQALRNQFCYVMVEAFAKNELSSMFWYNVYDLIMKKLEAHCTIAIGHLPDEIDRRRHFASKITMRFLKALADRAATAEDKSKLDSDTKGHLDRMLDYLLCDS